MIEVTVDTQAVEHVLRNLQAAALNMTPAFKDIGEHLVNTTGQRFADGKGPDGATWERNSEATLARKKSARPLIGETGSLENQISYDAKPQGVLIGSNMEYAAMQQFGGTQEQFPHLWGDIPARPFLGLSAEDEREVGEIVMAHLRLSAGL